MTNNRKFNFIFYFFACVFLTSCIYDKFDENFDPDHFGDEELAEIQKGYSLSLTVTLDKMGGAAATRVNMLSSKELKDLEEIENYINPELFRVLFFDDKDRFLFESKSRWVKRLSEKDDFTTWFVSVPVFPYGNDMDYDWDWPEIRKALTKEDEEDPKTFKIAILANRPKLEWCPSFDDTSIIPEWVDNSGPHWDKKDTGVKSVFDLHHCQYDPIYTGKSWATTYGTDRNAKEGFYEFIMGYDTSQKPGQELTMGVTSSWVDYKNNDVNKPESQGGNRDEHGWTRRFFKAISRDYPIPMYGIQEFDAIMDWTAGTPFNLSEITSPTLYNVKSVSMLRSVVKLELLIPKEVGDVQMCALMYPNIYARCEPMDVWHPTEEIWQDLHSTYYKEGDMFIRDKNGNVINDKDGNPLNDCEWKSIWNYGRITTPNNVYDTNHSNPSAANMQKSLEEFQERISWFYGAWKDIDPATGKPWWDFKGGRKDSYKAVNVVAEKPGVTPYPRVFNPCTQRNNVVLCDKVCYDDNDYYHYVVYTGERNINDPSQLFNMGRPGSGYPTIIYWLVNIKRSNGTEISYGIPITDYGLDKTAAKVVDYAYPASPGNVMGKDGEYEDKVFRGQVSLPFPLVRNHVYRLTLAKENADPYSTRAGGDASVMVTSEMMHSESIRFY